MEKELDPVVIKATQTSLGKYVKRPPLTEKLLKKPPFRFLHDIVTCVLNTTGFFEGLFDEEELVSENVKERENKIAFLNKVITVVGLTTGKSLSVKPSKVVAGQEPEKTNELLQCIAHALDNKLSSDDAVKKFKEGTKVTKNNEKSKDSSRSVKKPIESNKLTSRSNEKLISQKKVSTGSRTLTKNDNDKTNIKSKQKERNTHKNESPPKKPSSQQSKPTLSKRVSHDKQQESNIELNLAKNDAINNEDTKITSDTAQNAKEVQLVKPILTTADNDTSLSKNIENNPERFDEQNLNSSYTIVDNILNSSLSSQDLMETDNITTKEVIKEDGTNVEHISSEVTERDTTDVGKIINDKQTSHEENNKEQFGDGNTIANASNIQSNNNKDEEIPDSYSLITKSPIKAKMPRPLSVRPSSSRPGAPRPRDKHDNILVEAENIIVGKVNIISENTANEEEEDTSLIVMEQEKTIPEVPQDQEKSQASLNEHGHLVQQILNSQKEYSQMSGKTEIEWQFGAKKARDALNKEIEQLRYDIQALSRVANPLGKLLDHIQEDVEVMRQELHQWSKTFEEASKDLFIQKTANEESLYPLKVKVKQLDTDILEKHDKISDLKIIIHKNSLRIEKLLQNGIVQ